MTVESHNPNSDAIDARIEHLVDTEPLSYYDARVKVGMGDDDSETFVAVGEVDSTGIPMSTEKADARRAAREAAHQSNIEIYHLQTDEQRAWKPSAEEKKSIDLSIKEARVAAQVSKTVFGRK